MIKVAIPAFRLSELTDAIDALAARAVKLGVPVPTLEVGSRFVNMITLPSGVDHRIEYVNVTVDGDAPRIAGWSFIGVIESLDGGAFLVKSAPGATVPVYYQSCNPQSCDHCKINRFRRETFIVERDGEYKQVGRSCLKDFLGHADPEKIAAYCTALFSFNATDYADIDEMDFRAGRVKPVYSVADVIAVAHCAIKAEGYHKADSQYPTRDRVISHFLTNKEDYKYPVSESDRNIAPTIREYIKGMSGSEFAQNAATLANAEYVDMRKFGYLVAAVMMYIRAESDKAARDNVEINESALAAPGAKISVRGIIINAHRYENAYGVKSIYTIKAESGQVIKIFTTNNQFDKGAKVVVSGKYKGTEVESFARSPYAGKSLSVFEPRTRILEA